MIVLEILVSIPSRNQREFFQAFEMSSGVENFDRECSHERVDRSIFESASTPNLFLWIEKWTNRVALEKYMKTDRFKSLLGAIQILGNIVSIHEGELSGINPVIV
ncbi:MAG: hypothetical protein P8Y74_08835 [Desulfobacterales bacterium]|jgi:hypothetical protein